MKPAHIVALALLPFMTIGAGALCTCSRRVRDVFFFAMVSLAVLAERLDVNFFSEEWYRGTTRGIEVCVVHILAFGLLVGCVANRREGQPRWTWPASLALMLLYLFDAGTSVLSSDPKLFGLFEFSKIAGSILVFLASAAYARSRREWTVFVMALGCAVALEGIWSIKQHFFTDLERAEGSLHHANSLSMYLCMTAPVLAAMAFAGWSRFIRLFCGCCVLLAAIAAILALSRAGVPIFGLTVGGAILACATWRWTPRTIAIRALFAAGAVALVALSWSHLQERYEEASLEEEYFDPNVDGRGVYLRLAWNIVRDHFFGVGLNNWSYHVSRAYGPEIGYEFSDYDDLIRVYGPKDDVFGDSYLAAPAHNLAALTLGELGVPGFAIFTLLWLRWFGLSAPFLLDPRSDPDRCLGVGLFFGLLGIFGQSLTEWVYRQTPILLTLYLLLGVLANVAAQRRASRRAKASQWAADDASLIPETAGIDAGLPVPAASGLQGSPCA